MQHVAHPVHRPRHQRAVGDAALHHLDPRGLRQRAVMAEGADAVLAIGRVAEQAMHERLPHLARGAGDENETAGHDECSPLFV